MNNTTKTAAKKTVKLGACNIISAPWMAMIGCEGKGAAYRNGVGHLGRPMVEYACKVCRCWDRLQMAIYRGSSPIIGHPTGYPGQQKNLRDVQDAAGVVDYRTAGVKKIDGRWTITHPGYEH